MSWSTIIAKEREKPYMKEQLRFLEKEYDEAQVIPEKHNTLRCFRDTPFSSVRCVILSRYPYPNACANGLAFGSIPGQDTPEPLEAILSEARAVYGHVHTDITLSHWAKQGVLLMNIVQTCTMGNMKAHEGKGWEIFSDQILKELSLHSTPKVFMLWGNQMKRKRTIIDPKKHLILESAWPGSRSNKKFSGNKHFAKANDFLREHQLGEIEW